ncbi:MAG: NAD(P)/FAD-dependent oxidoreductase [Desulfuromonadaceae bacterium]|nr:NAD(P)/FAD-dependent oxidoreductase [Desulfuromonadaceae bacterium]
MLWSFQSLSLELEQDESSLPFILAERLQVPPASILQLKIVRRSIDARRKQRILRVYSLEFQLQLSPDQCRRVETLPGVERKAVPAPLRPAAIAAAKQRVVVVGMGPAGLFAALELARCGHQVILIERGRPVEQRVQDVEAFWRGGPLLADSNVQFGEGGAGTFSDGKLTTRIRHPLTQQVLQTLVDCGAPADILIQAKPHVGTDRLRQVLVKLRQQLLKLGVELRYDQRLSGLALRDGRAASVVINQQGELDCDALVLATGHSARDTYQLLSDCGLELEPKPFAMGVRVEHPARQINRIQYGMDGHRNLPAADYALTWNDPHSGRGVYSFCMCPGGQVVLSSSEAGGVVVNGMSDFSRDAFYSNSALVVAVRPEDFYRGSALDGMWFQRHWEQRAYGGDDYRPPAQNLLDFLGRGGGSVAGSCRPGVREADLREFLPDFVYTGLQQALPHFERRMRGFICREAVLVAPETRTSAPLRIVRTDLLHATRCRNLYPAGEGAGYAGGIMSAALDGLKVAQAVHESARF